MSGVNKHILVGRLGQNPDVRSTKSNAKVVTLSIAVSEQWRDKDSGERKESVSWHKVVIFNEKLAEVAEKYLKKGHQVYIEGQSLTRKYTGRDGIERYTTETVVQPYRGSLVLLERAEREPAPDENSYASGDTAPPIDDEIPF
jgi:single-strand DNA-binding protein